MLTNYGIILASGSGTRYSSDIPKQFVKIAGKTVLEHTIDIFEKNERIDNIILVITPEYRHFAEEIILKNKFKKIIKILNGGNTRKESSYIGISSIVEKEANVIIHDCARPFLSQWIINDCLDALKIYSAVDVAIPSADTIIQVDSDIISKIPNRKVLMRGQTPQCFKLSLLKRAHELSKNDENFTDDCGLIIKYNLEKVYVVQGDNENIKITYPSDVYLADRLFQIKSTSLPNNIDLNNLANKNIVVFGGTSEIGKCIINIAKKYNANVYRCSISTGCDISSYKNVETAFKQIINQVGCINYVVNTAGVLRMGKISERSIEDIIEDININYIGSINETKASIPYLTETKSEILLFTSSSYTKGRSLYSTYSSAKAGIVNFVQAMADELISDGIKINTINPERTATPMRFKAFGKEPLDSLLNPDIVAEVSLKILLSELTGEVIDVRK